MSLNSRFKDASPVNTVEKIKNILAKNQIEVEECWVPAEVKNCFSLRVSVKNAEFGANGKGMTKEFSQASGYAEFMERFQAGFMTRRMTRDNVLTYADEIQMPKDECIASCDNWIKNISKGLSSLFRREIPLDHIRSKCFESDAERETVSAVPYYNVMTDSFTYLPKKALPLIYNTNGLAAGNTLEEAFVQGLSEIFERHNVIRCFFGNVTLPTIPDDYLKQFEKCYETIEHLRENGLEVILKDCSMGEPYPLVAAIAIDRKHHAYHVHMGAHPVFEIALERSLTEMFQGRSLAGVANSVEFANCNTKTRSNSELVALLTKGCGQYPLTFFAGKPSYEFKPFIDRSKMSNAEMLKEFVDYIASRGYEMYVRDISHMGFPSVSIIVPGMSETFPHHLLDTFPSGLMYEKYKDAALHLDEMSIEQLGEYRNYLNHLMGDYGPALIDFRALTGKEITGGNRVKANFLARMVFAYMEWSFNRANAIKFAKAAIPSADEKQNNRLSCICAFYEHLFAGLNMPQIIEGLSMIYDEETMNQTILSVMSNENPFKPFLVHCAPELCEQCPFKAGCNVRETQRMIDLICKAALDFDAKASFEKVRALYQSL